MAADNEKRDGAPSLGKVLTSVIASFFGVQSNRRRTEDFTHGKASHYIVVGLGVTLLFILTVWGVVQLVLHLTAR